MLFQIYEPPHTSFLSFNRHFSILQLMTTSNLNFTQQRLLYQSECSWMHNLVSASIQIELIFIANLASIHENALIRDFAISIKSFIVRSLMPHLNIEYNSRPFIIVRLLIDEYLWVLPFRCSSIFHLRCYLVRWKCYRELRSTLKIYRRRCWVFSVDVFLCRCFV